MGKGNTEVDHALDGIAELYRTNLLTHGFDSKSVGWKDQQSQVLRFDKLAEVIPPLSADSSITVNDLGCGYGAMFRYLDERLGSQLGTYFGYDISPEMLRAAEKFVQDSRARLIQSSVLTEEADYTFVSGTFNVKMDTPEAAWADYVKEKIRELARQSRRGFAFNLLSTYVDWKQEDLFYADPLDYFDFCKKEISRYVALLHDYELYEWTIYVQMRSTA